MEKYIGKICPFCKTAITAEDEVMVCPSCATPHHKACWDENKGCTTFGCSEQHYVAQGTNPIDVCKKCGAALGDGQDFCPKCGTPKNAPDKNICAKCGTELADGQEFCPKCGQKVGLSIDSGVSSAISKFNSNVEANNEKKKKKPIMIAIILCVLVALGIGGFTVHKKVAEQKEAARIEELADDYRSNAKKFAALAFTAGANVEDIADTEQKYWREYIYDDKYSSIERAVLMVQIDKSDEISQAEKDSDEMKSLYNNLKKVPEGVEDSEIDEICDAVKDLYNIYTDYYSLAMNPTGSYNSFSESNQSKTDQFLSAYRALDNLLD